MLEDCGIKRAKGGRGNSSEGGNVIVGSLPITYHSLGMYTCPIMA